MYNQTDTYKIQMKMLVKVPVNVQNANVEEVGLAILFRQLHGRIDPLMKQRPNKQCLLQT